MDEPQTKFLLTCKELEKIVDMVGNFGSLEKFNLSRDQEGKLTISFDLIGDFFDETKT